MFSLTLKLLLALKVCPVPFFTAITDGVLDPAGYVKASLTAGRAKVDGSARFGIDVSVPGMLVGTIAHCPVFGGTLKAVDDKPALAVNGVRAVVKLPNAVAVVGKLVEEVLPVR